MRRNSGKKLLILVACVFALSFNNNLSSATETVSTINSVNLQEIKVKDIVVKFNDSLVSEDLKFILKDEKGNTKEISSKDGKLDSFTVFEGKKYTIKLKDNEKYQYEVNFAVKKYNDKYYAEINGKKDLVLKLEKKETNSDKTIAPILVKNKNKLVSDNLNFFVIDKDGNKQKVILNNGQLKNFKVAINEKYTLKLENNDKYTMTDLVFVVKTDSKGDILAYSLNDKVIKEISITEIEKIDTNTRGWVQDNNTKEWKYINNDGKLLKGWHYDDSYSGWYYFNSNGIMQKGWIQDSSNNWYLMDSSGKMKTGWAQDSTGSWYFLRANGKMETGWYYDNTYKGWFYLGNNGTMRTGWGQDSTGSWYYFNGAGKMQKGWIFDYTYNSYFLLRENGVMERGWAQDSTGKWYFFNDDGRWNSSIISFGNWYVVNGYFQTNSGNQKKYVGKDYIVVSLSSQKLWLVKGGELYFTTGVISGKNSTPTPMGSYRIQGKQTDRYLKGEDYKLHVDYWLPFNGDYGIHDAYWQRSYYNFENPRYQRSRGSHGCLNIFPKHMPTIYNSVYVGMPVIITD